MRASFLSPGSVRKHRRPLADLRYVTPDEGAFTRLRCLRCAVFVHTSERYRYLRSRISSRRRSDCHAHLERANDSAALAHTLCLARPN